MRGARATRGLAALIALVLTAGVVAAASSGRPGDGRVATVASTTTTTTTSTTTTTTSTTTTEPPATTTTEPPTTEPPTTEPPTTAAPVVAEAATTPRQPSGPLPAPGAWTADAYQGLGTWIDVYDWTAAYGGAQIALADIDRMAANGVQTLYVQPVRWDVPTALMETERLVPLLQRARAHGIRVVAWYLPDLRDLNSDLLHIYGIAQGLPIDGLAIDIESRSVEDVDLRNQQLLALSDQLRAAFPGQVLGGIVLPPVVMEDVNASYWPGYPWAGLAPDYDVWLPMAYATNRIGGWRDAQRYTAENVARVRAHLGQPGALVHAIGGIGDETSVDDINGMVAACRSQACTGASVYDYRTTTDPALWAALQAFRA